MKYPRAVPVPVSVLVLAKNEVDRLPDTLASVGWADEVVIADTGSTDGTVELARSAGARVVSIPWEGFVGSRNRALKDAMTFEYITEPAHRMYAVGPKRPAALAAEVQSPDGLL